MLEKIESIRVIYCDKSNKVYDKSNLECFYMRLLPTLIHEALEGERVLFIGINLIQDSEIQVEFGHKCCFISISNNSNGKAYAFKNTNESEELVDLYANCYPKNWLCFSPANVLQMISTFISTGVPDETFQWIEMDE